MGTRARPAAGAARAGAPAPAAAEALFREHARFLAFLRRRLGDAHAAEDVLQDAYVKALERGRQQREPGRLVPWFFRLLRRLVIDRSRRAAAATNALRARAGRGGQAAETEEAALHEALCRCVAGLLPTLRPEHAQILERVEIQGETTARAARALGLTPGNAAVRLHRARKALARRLTDTCGACSRHRCVRCRCREGRGHEGV